MPIDPWVIVCLLTFSVIATLVTNWLVGSRRLLTLPLRVNAIDFGAVIASLIWIGIVYAAGVVASRYIERITYTALGFLVFGLVAFLLSWVRASLYRRFQGRPREKTAPQEKPWLRYLVHNSTYLLFATILYLLLAWLVGSPAKPVSLLALWLGALLPDLDSKTSLLGRLLPFASRQLDRRFGHLQGWHSLGATAFIALATIPLVLVIGVEAWYLLSLGFFAHLFVDLLAPKGVMLFWPLTRTRYSLFGGFVESHGSRNERGLAVAMVIVVSVLVLVVDLQQAQPPAPSTPTYEQTLERYYSMRGKNLVFAYLEGTWQATGKPMSGRFELLNAVGESFLVLDRYDGKVFTAGRSAKDNLYINRIVLQPGSAVRIKPAEIFVRDGRLSETLPVLYAMQREHGLQHIFVSGDVIVPVVEDAINPMLEAEYAQTRLRRIQSHEPGHYSFHYLTASDLIALANLEVESAELVIVATYGVPATGPTVTPLPSPAPTPESMR